MSMMILYHILLAGGAVATLVGGIKYKHVILTGVSAALGFIWASVGHTIEFNSGKVIIVMKTPQIVLLAYLITALGVAFTMLGAMSFIKGQQKSAPAPGGYSS